MINRALIRLKIVQLVYAYYQNEGKTTEVALKEKRTFASGNRSLMHSAQA